MNKLLYAEMSPNEEYVLVALQSKFGGEILKGEDPPDAYLVFPENRIAVEVSSLVERVPTPSGKVLSRLALDNPAQNMIEEINIEMSDELPEAICISVGVPIPINSLRETKKHLKRVILDRVVNGSNEGDIQIEENRISIDILRLKGSSGKKVIGYFAARYSSANLEETARTLLVERISAKSKKCKPIDGVEDYWLALRNHYWVADAGTYQSAYESINMTHQFSKVLVIDGYKQVVCL